jgi:hypothetical protein
METLAEYLTGQGDGALGLLEAGAGADDGVGNGVHDFVLSETA